VGDRPRRLDLAWRSLESNAFGLNEFMRWAEQAGVAPMMAVNLGTRGVAEAAELVEYCNLPEGTAAADLRRKHGVGQPHDIRLWCLGNEMDGPWQIGALTAREYGRLAARAGHAMRRVDPSIELVACGSSNADMPTFAAWEATVLEETYDQVDYLSLHQYYDPAKHDEASFRASAVDLDGFVDDIIATADMIEKTVGQLEDAQRTANTKSQDLVTGAWQTPGASATFQAKWTEWNDGMTKMMAVGPEFAQWLRNYARDAEGLDQAYSKA
jgi:alpha-N-arabinofuranosidase